MKISCPSCSAKYSIADEKVHNRLAKIRCRKCSTTIVIDGKSNPPTVQTAESGAMASSPPGAAATPTVGGGTVYTVDIADDNQPQMTIDQIVEAYNAGTLVAETYVWAEGMGDWEALGAVPEINAALHRAAQQPQAAAPVATAPMAAAAVPMAAPAPESVDASPARAATRAATGRGTARDLFGGIDVAGSENDVTTSAAQAAVAASNTGARNESSVLFSLSALTAGEEPSPMGGASTTTNEDSGLIDLAALTAAADRGGASHGLTGLELGAAPLGSPLGAAPLLAAPAQAGAEQKSNKGVVYAAIGVAVAAVGALVFFVLKEEPPAPVPSAALSVPSAEASAAAALTAPGATASATAASASASASAPAPSATEEPSAKPPVAAAPIKRSYTPPTKKAAPSTPAPTKDTSSSKDTTPTKTKKKKKKKKASCNCKPSDLMCAMRCSAN